MREMSNAYKILFGNSEGKRPFARSWRRWHYKTDREGTDWAGVDWIHLAEDRGPVAGCYVHGNKPSGSIKGGKFPDKLNYY
jgi:hypothetical protein